VDTSEITKVEKPWGYELHWAKTDRYVGKILHINAGQALSLQYHNRKEETILLWAGRMLFEIERNGSLTKVELKPGERIHVAPKTVHRMTALEDCDIFEVSTPELDDVVRLEDRYGREDAQRAKGGRGGKPRGRPSPVESSERHVVFGRHVDRRVHPGVLAIHRLAAARPAPGATAAASEQDHAVGLHLGRVAVVPLFVLPLTGLQSSLHVDLLPLGEVLRHALRLLSPEADAVPLRLFLSLAVLVLPDLGRRHAEACDGRAAAGVPELGVLAQIAYEDDPVHGAHRKSFLSECQRSHPAVAGRRSQSRFGN
jgi:mannose-6-phosphate isomerase-like protein (cupin superfamily)